MNLVEWPLAAPAADHPVQPARPAGRDRLAAARADFFLDDRLRLSEQERALMADMLACLLEGMTDDLCQALPPLLAARIEPHRDALVSRLMKSPFVDRPALIALLLRRADEQRITLAGNAAKSAGGTLDGLVGDGDANVAAAAMELVVARGRRRDRFGRLCLLFDDLPAEEAVAVTWLIAAELRDLVGVPAAEADAALTQAAQALLARHDEGRRLEAGVASLAHMLDQAGHGERMLMPLVAEGDAALTAALLANRAGIDADSGWGLLVGHEPGGMMMLARLAGLARGDAARLVASLGEALGLADSATAIAGFDAPSAADVEAVRRWWRLPPAYRDTLALMGSDDGQRAG